MTSLVLSDHAVFTGRGLWAYYGFGQIYSNSTVIGGISQAWTLCIEVTFYAFLPIWAWLMRRTRANELVALGLLFALSVAWKFPFLAGHDPVPSQTALRSLPDPDEARRLLMARCRFSALPLASANSFAL